MSNMFIAARLIGILAIGTYQCDGYEHYVRQDTIQSRPQQLGDVSNVTNMYSMFYKSPFNQDNQLVGYCRV